MRMGMGLGMGIGDGDGDGAPTCAAFPRSGSILSTRAPRCYSCLRPVAQPVRP